ncbi:MAG: pirin family protein [Pyrinomonadaceae bacterium]|nr:pirin family protein [Pyrinomonadaceae bacterium]
MLIVIPKRTRKIGAIEVKRLLPYSKYRSVGPFIFFDHFGPVAMTKQVDILPHPHIGLATITYLFQGKLIHRDSLGSKQLIEPGQINLMSAGKGIVHSERVPFVLENEKLAGVQIWLALPENYEDSEPFFHHYDCLPELKAEDINLKVLMGRFFDLRSPVESFSSDALYLDCCLSANTKLELCEKIEELGVYILFGEVQIGQSVFSENTMIVCSNYKEIVISATKTSRVLIVGGSRLGKPRYMWWNFVSTSKDKIEEAKRKWERQEFPLIPDDNKEYIPLPNSFAQVPPL